MPDDTTLAGALQSGGGVAVPPNSSTGQLDLSVHPSDIDQTAVKPITADDVAQATHGAIKGTPTPSSTDDSTVKDLYAREAQDRLGLSFTPDLNDPKMVTAVQNALNMQAKGTLDSFAQGQLTGTDATVQSATPAPPMTQPDQPPAVTPTQPPAAQPPAPGAQPNVPQTPPTTSFAGTLINAESGGKNIANTTQTTSSGQAQGAFQITTGTWNDFGGKKYADTPLQASVSQQFEIAKGIPLKRWAAPTINALKAAGFKVDRR